MQSGRLRHIVYAKSVSHEQDDYGKQLDIFNDVFKFRANVQILNGTELLKSGAVHSGEFLSILARNDARLSYEHILVWNDNKYILETIKRSDDSREMMITASREF